MRHRTDTEHGRRRRGLRVGEVASRAGVSVRSVRYYERMGLIHASRTASGYREFDDTAVERAATIRALLASGFTVEEIRPLAPCLHQPPARRERCDRAVEIYREKLAQIDAQLRLLRRLRRQVEERIAFLQGEHAVAGAP